MRGRKGSRVTSRPAGSQGWRPETLARDTRPQSVPVATPAKPQDSRRGRGARSRLRPDVSTQRIPAIVRAMDSILIARHEEAHLAGAHVRATARATRADAVETRIAAAATREQTKRTRERIARTRGEQKPS